MSTEIFPAELFSKITIYVITTLYIDGVMFLYYGSLQVYTIIDDS